MGFHFFGPFLLAALGGLTLAACDQSYQNISPNYIGMKLTPTGYEDTIYTAKSTSALQAKPVKVINWC